MQEPKSQKTIFQEVWESSVLNANKAKKHGVKINSKNEQYYITPLLQKNKITSWEQIDKEATLIVEGKSNLSSKVRGVVDHIHTHVLITYQNQFDGK